MNALGLWLDCLMTGAAAALIVDALLRGQTLSAMIFGLVVALGVTLIQARYRDRVGV